MRAGTAEGQLNCPAVSNFLATYYVPNAPQF